MHLHHVGGGGGGRIMNVGGVTYSTDMGLGELYSYQILESRFTCNQGAVFQLVFLSTHVMTIEWYTCYYKMRHYNHM